MQKPLDLLPERLPRLSLGFGKVGPRSRVADAGQDGKAAKGFERLACGGRLGWTGARHLLRLRGHFGAELREGLLPQPRTGGLGRRRERLCARRGGMAEP